MPYTEPMAINCPECDREILKPLNWFKLDKSKCPDCNSSFKSDEFLKEISKIEEKLADVNIDVGKIGR
jgi:hypothetical protein